MLRQLRDALERRGLSSEAGTAEAETFYAGLSTEEKGHIGTELGREGFVAPGNKPLQRRGDPTDPSEMTIRSIQVRAQTANEQERTIEATISTDAAVEVYDFMRGERIEEVLLGSGAELPDQLPLLETHCRWALDCVLGSVRGLRVEGSNVVGRLHFAKDDEPAERAWNKVRQGHLTDVSVGYRVTESVEIAPGQSATIAGRQFAAGRLTLRIAIKWAPREVSLVPIGADPAAKMRDKHSFLFPKGTIMNPKLRAHLETIGLRANASDDEAKAFYAKLDAGAQTRADAEAGEPAAPPETPPVDPPPVAPPVVPPTDPPPAAPPAPSAEGNRDVPADPAAVARQAIAGERERVRALTELAGADVPEAVRSRAINDGLTVEQASPVFLGAIRTARQGTGTGPAIHVSDRDRDCNVRTLAAGLLIGQGLDPTQHSLHHGFDLPSRADALTEQDADRGDQFRNMSAPDLFRECLQLDTGRHYSTIDAALSVARAAPSGATLSHVFTTNVYAKLVEGWGTVPDTTAGWCDEEDVPNFMQQEDITLKASGRLDPLPRGDTAKHATFSDEKEVYKIARYAKQFVLDEQDIKDDRLGALLRVPAQMGAAAARLRPDLVYSLMLQNPTMTDTGAVFNVTAVTTTGGHANLGTGALADATLKVAISAMGTQRENGQVLNIAPRYLIVPAALDWTAQGLLSGAALAKLFADSSDPLFTTENLIARKRLVPIMDDRIGATGVVDPRTGATRTGSATNWFLAAGGPRSLRVAYLRGTGRRPVMRSFVLTQGQWGIGWDINYDVGAGFMDYRPWYKSTGAA